MTLQWNNAPLQIPQVLVIHYTSYSSRLCWGKKSLGKVMITKKCVHQICKAFQLLLLSFSIKSTKSKAWHCRQCILGIQYVAQNPPVGVLLPEFIRDIVDGRRWWIPLLLAVLCHLPRHAHREQPLRPGEGPAHLPGQGAGLPPCHPAARTQFNLLAL